MIQYTDKKVNVLYTWSPLAPLKFLKSRVCDKRHYNIVMHYCFNPTYRERPPDNSSKNPEFKTSLNLNSTVDI